jgi:hypothetical protein
VGEKDGWSTVVGGRVVGSSVGVLVGTGVGSSEGVAVGGIVEFEGA